jgi:hypothetical protein
VIAVDARGRLGNQLFQYAFGLTAAQILGTSFVFDARALDPYFVLGRHRRPHRLRDPLLIPDRREIVADDRDDPTGVLRTLRNRTRYGGHFYSYLYFAPAAQDVRRVFRAHDALEERFLDRYGALVAGGYACLHVRLTDFRTYRGGITLPVGYYERALASIGAHLPVVFVSDDIATVSRHFAGTRHASFEQNDEAVDLQLLRHATVVVTSNSSFAWWGAWLNERAERVLAPAGWLEPESAVDFPRSTLPPGWERVPGRLAGDVDWEFGERPACGS